ncbi:MAG: PrgI family protein [Lachnospiraceae bacterium]|nr:PrgI family protein [Lachnospiraceae bacterium]
MIEIKIPQEINKYESKLVGPFTTRQTICVICMAALCVGTYYTLKNIVSTDALYFVCFCIAIPFGLLGWYKPYGMKAEKFFLAVFFNVVISSSRRIFKSENMISAIESKCTTSGVEELNDKKKKAKSKKPKGTDYKKAQNKYRKETFK